METHEKNVRASGDTKLLQSYQNVKKQLNLIVKRATLDDARLADRLLSLQSKALAL